MSDTYENDEQRPPNEESPTLEEQAKDLELTDQPASDDPERERPPTEEEKQLPGSVRGPATPRKRVWGDYASRAVQQLYPHLREGVDYAWGRPPGEPDAEPRMLSWDSKFAEPDMGEVEKLAKRFLDEDPYANYQAQKPLHSGTVEDSSNSNLSRL